MFGRLLSTNEDAFTIDPKIEALFDRVNQQGNPFHTKTSERCIHLQQWYNGIQLNYEFMEENWDHPDFHPFKTCNQALEYLKTRQHEYVLRLSSSEPSYISISAIIEGGESYEKREYLERWVIKDKLICIDGRRLSMSEFVTYLNECRETECPICYEQLFGKQIVKMSCGHRYHKTCMRSMLQSKAECCLCRTVVTTPIRVELRSRLPQSARASGYGILADAPVDVVDVVAVDVVDVVAVDAVDAVAVDAVAVDAPVNILCKGTLT